MKLTVKISLCGLLTAFALISFILEGLFPPLFIPGARLGISNVFILLCAVILGGKYAFAAVVIKTTLGSVFSGNLSAILYSLPSGLIALIVQLILLNFTKVSVVATSVCGSIVNTSLQNLTFCLITGVMEYISYLPYLALIGALSGVLVGFTVYLAVKFIPLEKSNL